MDKPKMHGTLLDHSSYPPKRDVRISVIRLLCTCSIVILHITQQFESVFPPIRFVTQWLNLGLVMFFCISAFLYSGKKITSVFNWYLHRYVEIAVPSILVGLCSILIFSLRGEISSEQIWGTILSCIGLQVYAPNSWLFIQLWFLTYILFFYLTVPLIQKIDCLSASTVKFWGTFAAILFVAQLITVLFENITGIPLLSVGILLRLYLPYFVFRRYDINGKSIKPVIYFFTAISAIAIAVTCWVKYTKNINLPGAVVELIFIYTQSVAGFVLFYWLYRAFSTFKNYTLLLKLSDRFSYEVYLTHCLFIGYSSSWIIKYNYQWQGVMIALLLTLVSSVALHYLSKPIKLLLHRKRKFNN